MKKNTIKLNESQLRKVIAESIKKTLNENFISGIFNKWFRKNKTLSDEIKKKILVHVIYPMYKELLEHQFNSQEELYNELIYRLDAQGITNERQPLARQFILTGLCDAFGIPNSEKSENNEQLNEHLSAGVIERKLRRIVAESIKKTLNEKNEWEPDRVCLYGEEERETLKFWYNQVMKHRNEFNKFCEEYDENGQSKDYAELFINEMQNEDCEAFYLTVAIYMNIRSLKELAQEWVEYINNIQKYGYDDPVNGYNDQYFADMEQSRSNQYTHRW